MTIGERWIVKDGQGRPRAAAELTQRRFEDAGEGFAHDEGEGDRSSRPLGAGAHQRFHAAGKRSQKAWSSFCERFGLLEILDRG